MSGYSRRKKIHKRKVVSGCGVPTWHQPVCKVHNKTWAYTMTKNWKDVTCEVCLKYKGTKMSEAWNR
jgi:hypothetical protein